MLGLVVLVVAIAGTTMADESNARMVADANNQFTNGLYKAIADENPGQNLFMSPFSVHTALGMLHQGAAGASDAALSTALHLPDKAKSADGFKAVTTELNNLENVTLEIANKVYVMEGYKLKATFKSVVTDSYNAEAENVDFAQNVAAAKTVNTWVEEKTHDKIKDLIQADDLNSDTRSVLVNAIYFKGDWMEKFDKKDTRKEDFHVTPTETVQCDMMHITKKFGYKEDADLDAKIVKLPYKNPKLSMVIVLPNKIDGIGELEGKLATYDLSQLTKGMYNPEVQLSMPKFKFETKIELNEPLKKLGLGNIFSDAADFSGLLESPEPLKVSKVVQKAFIEVNEEGSEAAAATAGFVRRKRCIVKDEDERVAVVVDRPFLFLVESRCDGVRYSLFKGRVATAESSACDGRHDDEL